MAEMNKKAANEGDKLKHPLLLEVLVRCKNWPSLIYAETHAGAGKYLAADQEDENRHITDLYNFFSDVKEKPVEEAAGGSYYHLLQDWWAVKGKDSYPGSVLQAARFLTRKQIKAEYRVTEADKDTHNRLAKEVSEYEVQSECEKFQKKIDWLTEKDYLVLLIDPLSFGEDFGATTDEKLNGGALDLPTLTKVLDPCWGMKAAVILLWSGFGHNPRGKMPGLSRRGWFTVG
jgi:23S rRNA A2030 N6-methylase RlmJ